MHPDEGDKLAAMPRQAPRVGVLCYSLTPATVELFNAIHEKLREEAGGELRAFCVAPPASGQVTPTFAFEAPKTPPRFVTFGGRRGSVPESHVLALGVRAGLRLVRYSDVVLLFGIQGIPAVIATLTAHVLGKPVIVASQMMPLVHELRRVRLVRWLKGIVLRGADAHIAQTAATRDVLEQLYGVRADKIAVVPFTGGARAALSLLEVAPKPGYTRVRYGIPPDALVYLFVGTLIYLKGVDLLVPAFAEVAREDPRAFLLIAGPDGGAGGMARKVYEDVRAARLEDRVKICGPLPWEQVIAIYKAADVFVLPTRKDMWPKVVVEAALAGLPIIVTEVAGVVGTLVVDGSTGRVIPVDDRAALINAMREMRDSSKREEMGRASREEAMKFTDLMRETQGYVGLIRQVMQSRGVGDQK